MYPRQYYGWGNAIADIANAFAQRAVKDKAEKDAANAATGLLNFGTNTYNPSLSTTTIDGQKAFNADYNQINTPFGGQGFGVKNAFALQAPTPAPVTAPKFQTTVKDWATVRNEYMQDRAAKLKELRAQMGDAAFAKAYPQLMAQIKDGETALRGDYDKRAQDEAWNTFSNAPDYKGKIIAAARAGLNPGFVKMALDTGKKIERIQLGDKVLPVIVDEQNQSLTNAITGKPITQEELMVGMSPSERDASARGWAHVGIAQQNADRAASNQGKLVPIPGFGNVTVEQLFNLHDKARPKKKEVIDQFGNKQTVDEGNPALFAVLDPIVKGTQRDMGVDVAENDLAQEKTYIQEALAGGAKPEQIKAKLMQRTGELAAKGIDVNELLKELEPRAKMVQPEPLGIDLTNPAAYGM
jgi:hypothetical protein